MRGERNILAKFKAWLLHKELKRPLSTFPMKHVGVGFCEAVPGHMVRIYEDRNGDKWMAHHAWDLGRVLYSKKKGLGNKDLPYR